MCKVYNQIGSLTVIKSHLNANGIYEYRSVRDLIDFRDNYSTAREQIIEDHRVLIDEERNTLPGEITQLADFIKTKRQETEQKLQSELERLKQQLDVLSSHNSNIIQVIGNNVKKIGIKRNIRNSERTFNSKIESSHSHLTNDYNEKKHRYEYINSNFDDAVTD